VHRCPEPCGFDRRNAPDIPVLSPILLLLLLLAACRQPVDDRAQIRREYAVLRPKLLLDHPDETAINRAWPLLTRWTNAQLRTHPKDLARAVRELDPTLLTTSATRLRDGVYVVSAAYPRSGTFFVVDGDHVAWDVKTPARAHLPKRDEIGKWAWIDYGYGDGPLRGVPQFARANRNGIPRFYVDANTAPDWGGTYSQQISVWEWNGRAAVPLFIQSYLVSFDTGADVMTPDLLTIHTKGRFKWFFSCGGCPEPEMIWKIAITPDGVRDLGTTDVVPILRRLDDLFDRVAHDRDASDFAAPPVVRSLKPLLGKEPSMLMEWSVENHVLKFSSEAVEAEFDFVDHPNGAYFTTVRVR
jgi:hypothetical protein